MGIGTILVERGLITESQLDEAIADQKRTGERLDHVLVRLGCVDADKVLEAIGRLSNGRPMAVHSMVVRRLSDGGQPSDIRHSLYPDIIE